MIEHNEIFEMAFKFATETNENIFLTGKAGTGKTTFLKYLTAQSSKNIVVAAPTGVAAINAGGVTLHSLFQLPFHPFLPTTSNKADFLAKSKLVKQRQQLLRNMDMLVIDEISMVRADVLDAVDTILKSVRRNYNLPFGGVQLLFIGDLHQLPPVAQQQEWSILQEYYGSVFFFDALVLKDAPPILIELTKIYRQKEESFVELLNKVRNNKMDTENFEALNQKYNPKFEPTNDEKYIILTSHNKQADTINQNKIAQLTTFKHTFKAKIEHEFPESAYPVEAELILKKGAQVMFLKNDPQKQYFNGKIGIIKDLKTDEIIVDCDGSEIIVGTEIWENTRYTLNKQDGKLVQETLGTFTQYPLRLAWAITIHKSQGLTFEKVMIDAGASFSSGQVYVALSRCTSLDGIVLLSKIKEETLFTNNTVISAEQNLTEGVSLPNRFLDARKQFTFGLLEEIFSFTDASFAIKSLAKKINEHQKKLNPTSKIWISDLSEKLALDADIGKKFMQQVISMLETVPIIELNQALQNRIIAATNHFEIKILSYQNDLKSQPLVTEHKETSTEVNEALNELYLDINKVNYFLEYCKKPFAVDTFLKHKLAFAPPTTKLSCYASSQKIMTTNTTHTELYNKLRQWRDITVSDTNMPIYMVANSETLKELAEYLPQNRRDLLKIAGFGPGKVAKFGDEILEILNNFCAENNLESKIETIKISARKDKVGKPKPENVIDTKTESLNLFKQGKSIEQIANERNLGIQTIQGHLAHFVGDNKIDINALIPIEKQKQIEAAILIHGAENKKLVVNSSQGSIGYGEITLMLAALKQNHKLTLK